MTQSITKTAYYSEPAFFDAWLRGVEIAGSRWFGDQSGRGTSKYDFAPRYDDIIANLGILSSGEAAFLAAMYSFYNSHSAKKMFDQLHIRGLADLSANLDEPRCRVIADLLVSYEGW